MYFYQNNFIFDSDGGPVERKEYGDVTHLLFQSLTLLTRVDSSPLTQE